jgi:hypothetical protein
MAEPIIIKGGSLSIEFENAFGDDDTAAAGKKGFKHPSDVTLTELVITRNGGKDDPPITLYKKDKITIRYVVS